MDTTKPVISFDNTEFAFEYKTDKQLKKARFLFSMMGKPWLVKIGTRLAPWSRNCGGGQKTGRV
jgi:proline dehydrogenase